MRPTWSDLRGWGNSRLIKTSYLWIVLVPLAAKALAPMAGTYTFELWGQERSIHIGLPFRWSVLFFMALFFALGQGLYAVFCPGIIKRYANFTEYRRHHPGSAPLCSWLEQWIAFYSKGKKEVTYFLCQIGEVFHLSGLGSETAPDYDKLIRCIIDAPDAPQGDVFDVLVLAFRDVEHRALYASTAAFGIGFLLFCWLIVQNIIFVIRAM